MNLTPTDQAKRTNSPPLQGRGRGWGLSAEHIAKLQDYAIEMRREPAEPERRLWRVLSRSQLGGCKFRRQAVIGPFIADFLCPQKALVIEVDGKTHEDSTDRRRDHALEQLGFTARHFTNDEIMRDLDGVREAILTALQQASDRWASPHPNPSPKGEGLKNAEAQKLLGISLEGSVG